MKTSTTTSIDPKGVIRTVTEHRLTPTEKAALRKMRDDDISFGSRATVTPLWKATLALCGVGLAREDPEYAFVYRLTDLGRQVAATLKD